MSDNICDFQFKMTENHNFTNNQYEPACGILSLLDILHVFPLIGCFINVVSCLCSEKVE